MHEEFTHEAGLLIRDVIPRRGRPYRHTCRLGAFKAVLAAIEKAGSIGVTTGELWSDVTFPNTQVSVAVAFLKERGCVRVSRRRVLAASTFLTEDGLTEWHAL